MGLLRDLSNKVTRSGECFRSIAAVEVGQERGKPRGAETS